MMKTLVELHYGKELASLNERMDWIELLYHEVQLYKTLQVAVDGLPEKDFQPLFHEIGKKKAFLLEYLPPLRK